AEGAGGGDELVAEAVEGGGEVGVGGHGSVVLGWAVVTPRVVGGRLGAVATPGCAAVLSVGGALRAAPPGATLGAARGASMEEFGVGELCLLLESVEP